MPDKVATITGLRGMLRTLGSASGIALATVLIHATGDVQRAFFIVVFGAAVLMLACVPAIFAMPSSPTSGARATAPRREPSLCR